MKTSWLRGARALATLACVALLAACGSGTIESQLNPSRIVVFGDAFSDTGNTGVRYTVNDGTVNIWTARLASNYAKTLTTSSAGGLNYAVGNARVAAKPDAAGKAATATIQDQITTFLSANTIGNDDVIVIAGGVSDIVAQMQAYLAGSQTQDTTKAAVTQAGKDLATQVQRLINAGGKHVVLVGSYNLAKSPWGVAIGQTALLETLSTSFNSALLVDLANAGSNALYVDAAYYFNLVAGSPSSYSLNDATTMVCNSVDSTTAAPGPIGIGANQVSSTLCNASTVGTLDYAKYLFADGLHFTPIMHQRFGDYAYDRIRARW